MPSTAEPRHHAIADAARVRLLARHVTATPSALKTLTPRATTPPPLALNTRRAG